MHSPIFHALNREFALTNRVLGAGLTAIRAADLSNKGAYAESFFNISIGIERLGKLIFILDHCFTHHGQFPDNKDLTKISHDLTSIIGQARNIRSRYPTKKSLAQFDDSAIGKAIIDCLTSFAKATRYYNLDFITAGKSASVGDPIQQWHTKVITPILEVHYSEKQRAKDELHASIPNLGMWDTVIMTRYTAEDGEQIDDYGRLLLQANQVRYANKWAQLYMLRIVRFMCMILMDFEHKSYEVRYDFIPSASDYFGRFYNDDRYFKTRKAWNKN